MQNINERLEILHSLTGPGGPVSDWGTPPIGGSPPLGSFHFALDLQSTPAAGSACRTRQQQLEDWVDLMVYLLPRLDSSGSSRGRIPRREDLEGLAPAMIATTVLNAAVGAANMPESLAAAIKPQSLATGHGAGVCSLLHWSLDAALAVAASRQPQDGQTSRKKGGLRLRRPDWAALEAADAALDDIDGDDAQAMDIAAGVGEDGRPLPRRRGPGGGDDEDAESVDSFVGEDGDRDDDDDDEDEAYYSVAGGADGKKITRSPSREPIYAGPAGGAGGHGSGSGSFSGALEWRRKWREECERVWPRLGNKALRARQRGRGGVGGVGGAAGAAGVGGLNAAILDEWRERREKLLKHAASVRAWTGNDGGSGGWAGSPNERRSAGAAAGGILMQQLGSRVARDLKQIASSEARFGRQYDEDREAMRKVRERQTAATATCNEGQAELGQLSEELGDVKSSLKERGDSVADTAPLQA
eukprot:g6131.t1